MLFKKFVKRFVFFISFAGAGAAFLAAQDASPYEVLLKQGEKYEAEKKYVYALDSYWEAMLADQTFAAEEACKKYNSLLGAITSGNPGYGTFDDFSLYDCWLSLLQEAEVYFSENPPATFYTRLGEKQGINQKAKTVNYDLCIDTTGLSKKAASILTALRTGLGKKRIDGWDGISSKWPLIPVSSSGGKAMVSTLKFPDRSYEKDTDTDGGVSCIGQDFIYLGASTLGISNYFEKRIENFKKSFDLSTWAIKDYSVDTYIYEAGISILDGDGKEVQSFAAQKIDAKTYSISLQLNQKANAAVESGKYSIKINDLRMNSFSYTGSLVKVRDAGVDTTFDLTDNTWKEKYLNGLYNIKFTGTLLKRSENLAAKINPLAADLDAPAIILNAVKQEAARKEAERIEAEKKLAEEKLKKDIELERAKISEMLRQTPDMCQANDYDSKHDGMFFYYRISLGGYSADKQKIYTSLGTIDSLDNVLNELKALDPKNDWKLCLQPKEYNYYGDATSYSVEFYRELSDEELADLSQDLVYEYRIMNGGARDEVAAAIDKWYRKCSPKEKEYAEAAYNQMNDLKNFENGTLFTNLHEINFTEKKGVCKIKDFKKGSSLPSKGLMKNDTVQKIILVDGESRKEVSVSELDKIPSPATCVFTVSRGSGKKLQQLEIEISVEWIK